MADIDDELEKIKQIGEDAKWSIKTLTDAHNIRLIQASLIFSSEVITALNKFFATIDETDATDKT